MGLVRVVVYANWNFGRSAQRVPVVRVRNGDPSSHRVCRGISSGPLPPVQTILPEEDAPGFPRICTLWFEITALSFNKRSFRIAFAAG